MSKETESAELILKLYDLRREAKMREANGRYFVFVGPYPERDEARRVADRITGAFGFATTIAVH